MTTKDHLDTTKRVLLVLLCSSLVLALSACDSGDGDGGDAGPVGADVTATGGYSDSFEGGSAAFYFFGGDFYLHMIEDPEGRSARDQSVLFAFLGDARPAEGEYRIGEVAQDGDFGGGYQNLADGVLIQVPAESGTITITSSSDGRVAGSFSFIGQATRSSSSGGDTLGTTTVQGDFVAEAR